MTSNTKTQIPNQWPFSVTRIPIGDIPSGQEDKYKPIVVVAKTDTRHEYMELINSSKPLEKGFYTADANFSHKFEEFESDPTFKYDPKTKRFIHFPKDKLDKMVSL